MITPSYLLLIILSSILDKPGAMFQCWRPAGSVTVAVCAANLNIANIAGQSGDRITLPTHTHTHTYTHIQPVNWQLISQHQHNTTTPTTTHHNTPDTTATKIYVYMKTNSTAVCRIKCWLSSYWFYHFIIYF